MHPVFFNIGSFPIHSFGIMLGLGFLATMMNWIWLGKKEGRDSAYCSDLLFWIMISGVVGARLMHVISDLSYYLEAPVRIFKIWEGGLIYYGGFAGAAIAVFVFAKVRHEKLMPLVDFVATSIPIGHAFGRIGCFLNGCCHGIVYDGLSAVKYPGFPTVYSIPWREQFNAYRVAWNEHYSLPVVPVQLFEAAFNVVLFLVLIWAYRRRKRDGDVAALYLLCYPIARFTFEFLRGDERDMWLGLSVAQVVSIGLFVVGLAILLWPRPLAQHGKGSLKAYGE